ncbi:hypothetical protein ACFL96_09735 [Thermoproteota archaeon]
MNSITKNLSIVVVLVSMIFTPHVVLALAPADPSFYPQFSVKEGEVAAGSSGTFELEILSQEGYEGNIMLELEDPPSGVTATFDPNPTLVPGYGSGISTVTINVASSVPEGSIALSVLGTDETGAAKPRSAKITITVTAGSGDVTPPDTGSVPTGDLVTTTVTSTFTTTLSTVTTTTTVTATTTQIITTNTSPVATKTTVTEFDQVADLIYPIGTLVIVIILIGVAVVMLRKPKA